MGCIRIKASPSVQVVTGYTVSYMKGRIAAEASGFSMKTGASH